MRYITKIEKLLMACLVAMAFYSFSSALDGTAEAAQCRTRTACDAAKRAARAPASRGKKARTTSPMVCLSVVYEKPTELVLVNGTSPTSGQVLLRWRPSSIKWRAWKDGNVRGTICIKKKAIEKRRAVTLCNGKKRNEGNHSTWRRSHIEQLLTKRRIPASDPACLLGSRKCAKYGL